MNQLFQFQFRSPSTANPSHIERHRIRFPFEHRLLTGLLAISFLGAWGGTTTTHACWIQDSAMESTQTSAPPNSAAQNQNKKDESTIPAPKELTLNTKDGVALRCTYLSAAPVGQEGKNASGKTTLPFILLHDWEGDRSDLFPLAKFLQSLGCAVIVPDLRGHGQSTARTGSSKPLDYKKFRKQEIESTLNDIESCKRYLVQRNNEGKLNINMLNLVAVGDSAVLATRWTLSDWFAFPPMKAGIKQGQDVRSLTLIAPRRRLGGMNLNTDIRHELFSGKTGPNLPTLIVWPANEEDIAKDSSAIFERMRKGRPDVEKIDDPAEREKATTLYSSAMPRTRANGTVLVRDNPVAGLWPFIARFVATQVGANRDNYPWQSREKK